MGVGIHLLMSRNYDRMSNSDVSRAGGSVERDIEQVNFFQLKICFSFEARVYLKLRSVLVASLIFHCFV